MRNSFILLKIKKIDILELQKFLIDNGIYYKDLIKKERFILVKIDIINYRTIINYYGKRKIKKVKYYGILGIKKFIKREYIFILSIIFSLIIIYILSNTIFSIEIISNNKNIKNIVIEELKENGIEKYKFIKSYKEIENIKNKILKNNSKTIEWIEINRKGTKYKVNLTERIKNEESKENELRHIVAAKDALILKLVNRRGQVLKLKDEYVKKGEIIVSGDIYRGEETLVDKVEADADIYGEVWYTVNVTIPFEFVEYVPTGKIVNHYYLKFPFFNMTLLGYYNNKNVISEKEVLLDKPYLLFKLVKEKKTLYKYETFKINEKEALEEAIKRAEKGINNELSNDEYIIDKKVLKNSTFSSKINVEVFFKVYENIKDYLLIENIIESDANEGNN